MGTMREVRRGRERRGGWRKVYSSIKTQSKKEKEFHLWNLLDAYSDQQGVDVYCLLSSFKLVHTYKPSTWGVKTGSGVQSSQTVNTYLTQPK